EEERVQVEGWLRKQPRSGDTFSDQFRNRARIEFLMELQQHSGIDDEALLEEYRKFGLYSDLADLLLARHRVDEALVIASAHIQTAHEVFRFADKLLELGE